MIHSSSFPVGAILGDSSGQSPSHMLHVWNIYQHLPQKSPSFVGKYSSTMEHLGMLLGDSSQSTSPPVRPHPRDFHPFPVSLITLNLLISSVPWNWALYLFSSMQHPVAGTCANDLFGVL